MHSYTEVKISPYSVKKLFDLVADIESYPEFVPWCSGARILSIDKNIITAELLVNFKAFVEKYTSHVELIKPTKNRKEAEIKVKMIEGPFNYLTNDWKFRPHELGGTEISFEISFEFKSKIMNSLFGYVFETATKKMMNAFSLRADHLYGP